MERVSESVGLDPKTMTRLHSAQKRIKMCACGAWVALAEDAVAPDQTRCPTEPPAIMRMPFASYRCRLLVGHDGPHRSVSDTIVW